MPRKKIKDKEWPVIRYHKPRDNWVVDAGTKISQADPKTQSKERIRKKLSEFYIYTTYCIQILVK